MAEWHCVLHLAPEPAADRTLTRTVAAYEALANWLDGHVPRDHPANLVALHRSWYDRARRETALPAQMVTLGLRDWVARRRGETVEGVPYDRKLFSIRGLETVSLATVDGRLNINCVVSDYGRGRVGSTPARLIKQDAHWALKVELPAELPFTRGRNAAMSPDTVLTRVGRVITGLTHAAVDAAEQVNPVAVIEQAIREIESAIEEVRTSLGKAIAEQHRIDLRLDELGSEHTGLDEKIKLALGSKREDLARGGVARQIDIEKQSEVLKKLRGEVSRRIEELEGMIDAMWASRREAEDRLREFKQSTSDTAGPNGNAGAPSVDGAASRVERAQRVLDRITAVPGESGLRDQRTLEELEKLRRDRAIEERLGRLRSQS